MSEKIEKPKLEIIRGDQDYIEELSATVQKVLKNLPENFGSLVDTELVAQKRREVILFSNKDLLEYLQGSDLFKDTATASHARAVIEVVRGKIMKAI